MATGCAELTAVVFLRSRTSLATVLAVLGSALIAFGASLPDLEEAEVSARSGFRLRRRVRRRTTRLAEVEEVSLGDGGTGDARRQAELVDASRVAAASDALAQILDPDSGPLAGATLHLYLYDAETERVRALGVEGPPGEEGWAVGTGATGRAYETGQFVLVTGDAVYDATYGLSHEQQDRARDLAVVAAMPVMNSGGEVIGVLTGSSPDPDSPLQAEEGYDALMAAAFKSARVLIDLLKWFPDRYDGA